MSRMSTTTRQRRAPPALPSDADGAPPARRRRARSLTEGVVESLETAIRTGQLAPGDKLPTESEIMALHGVSRTVVREALSRLQAAGWVQTRHGIGTFVLERATGGFGIGPADVATTADVIAVLELRISLETESAGLAAQRRSPAHLAAMRAAINDFEQAIVEQRDAVASDLRFHLALAQATGNRYFGDILDHLGTTLIPRTRVRSAEVAREGLPSYLRRVNREHEQIYEAIARQDAEAARAAMRVHLTNSRERLRRAQRVAQAAR